MRLGLSFQYPGNVSVSTDLNSQPRGMAGRNWWSPFPAHERTRPESRVLADGTIYLFRATWPKDWAHMGKTRRGPHLKLWPPRSAVPMLSAPTIFATTTGESASRGWGQATGQTHLNCYMRSGFAAMRWRDGQSTQSAQALKNPQTRHQKQTPQSRLGQRLPTPSAEKSRCVCPGSSDPVGRRGG
jgi:hypothetical protein